MLGFVLFITDSRDGGGDVSLCVHFGPEKNIRGRLRKKHLSVKLSPHLLTEE